MKKNPVLIFGIVLMPVAVLTAGYALIENPASGRIAAVPSRAAVPAQEEGAFSDESKLPVPASGSGEQVSGETQGSRGSEPSPGIQSSAATAQFQVASGGIDGDPPVGIQADAGTGPIQEASTGASSGAQGAPALAPIPLAFRPLPPEVATAHPQLAAAVRGLQQDFVDAIGGTNQDPNSAAYYQRWIAAQTSVDEQYRVLVGNQAFLSEQMTVNNQ
jgi:hypothetical protein